MVLLTAKILQIPLRVITNFYTYSVLSDELEMQTMTLSIAGEINSVCMTKEDCTFIYSIFIDDVKLSVKKLKSGKSGGSSGNHKFALCQTVKFMVLIYYIIILHYCLRGYIALKHIYFCYRNIIYNLYQDMCTYSQLTNKIKKY